MRLRSDSNQGFTLVEVVLAVAVLAFGIVGVIRAYGVSVRALSAEQAAVDNIFLLKEKMADVEFEALVKDGVAAGALSGAFGNGFDGFCWDVRVSPIMVASGDDGGLVDSGLSRVAVTVFSSKDGLRGRHFSLFTYMNDRDVNGLSG